MKWEMLFKVIVAAIVFVGLLLVMTTIMTNLCALECLSQ